MFHGTLKFGRNGSDSIASWFCFSLKLQPVSSSSEINSHSLQLTLIHFDLYRAIKPIELVGQAWMKSDKYKKSPQLLKLTDHSTQVGRVLFFINEKSVMNNTCGLDI